MKNPFDFLKKKYSNLHTSPEVVSAAKRTEIRSGKTVSENPAERIENYLNRFKEILDRTDPEKRQQGIQALKKILYKQLVIKPENIPLDYFLDQEQRIAEQQGHGRSEPSKNWKESKTKEIQEGQKRSLDAWIDYLSSPDALYPDWAKYWAFRSMTQMGGYNKKEGRYGKRTETSAQPFPTLNIACLAKTIDVIQKNLALQGLDKENPERLKKEKELMYALNHDSEYRALVSTENFVRLYTYALEQFSGMSFKHLENIAGKWKTYPKGSDPRELYDSLQGYPLEWCTATNIETARTQLQGGDFHVYYSQDENAFSVIPRVAIRMTGNSISEIRGIEKDQNIDQFIQPVIDEKLDAFGNEGKQYLKKSEDMKQLTAITEKHRAGLSLTKEDLLFVYQVNNTIQGFGYQDDPRIAEILSNRDTQSDVELLYDVDFNNIGKKELECIYGLLKTPVQFQTIQKSLREVRNINEDLPIIFNCTLDQIATSVEQVNENTVTYIGPWSPDIMHHIPDTVEHLYESFPDKKIFRKTIELTPKTPEQYSRELIDAGNQMSTYVGQMLNKIEPLQTLEPINLVSFTVGQLGFPNGATLQDIYTKAESLGLELCPPQVGTELRLQYTDQPNGEYLTIAMNPITDAGGNPRLFYVGQDDSKSWLSYNDGGRLSREWGSDRRFVFRSRK
jgi:hypothetical protein